MRTHYLMKRHWVAAAAVAILSGAALLALVQGPKRLDGAGVMYGHLWCMGIKFDSERPTRSVPGRRATWCDDFRATTQTAWSWTDPVPSSFARANGDGRRDPDGRRR